MQIAVTEHMADVQTGLQYSQNVAVTQRVPGIDDGILAETHVHAGLKQFVHTGDTTAFREVVEAALQVDAFGGARDKADARVP